jgi:K+-sensing histidine kinase KdpD
LKEGVENQSGVTVSWDNIVRFVGQLSHNLRNDLNAVELQAALLGELTSENAELKEEVKRLREMIAKFASSLQRLSAAVGQINANKMPYRVSDFMDDLRERIAKDFSAESSAIKWEGETGDAMFEVDPQLLLQAFRELFTNAFQHERTKDPLSALAKIDNGNFVFTLREPKAGFQLPTENWGRQPLGKVQQGHYGLGLNRVRAILEAHGGDLRAQYDPTASALVSTITLPISPPGK